MIAGWEIQVCRMIIAQGTFSVVDVMSAARAMAAGETATHDGVIKQHLDGWGCLWITHGKVRTLHGEGSFVEALSTMDVSSIKTRFLAVHVRHATLRENSGIKYSHPLKFDNGLGCWYLMHNGYLPTVYLHLGLKKSSFDSAEYLEYIVGSVQSLDISEVYLTAKLSGLLPGGSSGNCFLIAGNKAWAWQWFSKDIVCADYFTMRHFKAAEVEYISSEILPFLGDEPKWRSMRNGELYQFNLIGG